MRTLHDYTADPEELKEILDASPDLFLTIGIACFSASIMVNGQIKGLKRQYIAYNATFYLEVRNHVDCYLIATYKAEKIISVTIHND